MRIPTRILVHWQNTSTAILLIIHWLIDLKTFEDERDIVIGNKDNQET